MRKGKRKGKDRKKWLLIPAVLAVGLFAELFFWKSSTEPEFDSRIGRRYVYLTPLGQVDFRKLAAEGILDADEAYGTDTELWACADLEGMCEVIDRSTYAGADGIILSGSGYSENLAKSIHKARSAGIPVVMIDSKIEGLEYDCFIGIDNYEAGKTAAGILLEEYDKTGENKGTKEAAVLVSRIDAENQKMRLQGFWDTWEERCGPGTIHVVETNGEYVLLKEAIADLLEEKPSLTSFFCAEAISSVHLNTALEALQATDREVVGFDQMEETLENVRENKYLAVIGQDVYAMGYQAIRYLADESDKTGAVEPLEKTVEVAIIDGQNAEDHYGTDMGGQKWKTN